jgi:hypothetical protein
MSEWSLTIIDAEPPNSDLGSLACGDIDGDGHVEVVVAGTRALSWYRPAKLEHGVIDSGPVFQVGVTLVDLDNDGVLELVIGDCDPPKHLFIYKPGPTPSGKPEIIDRAKSRLACHLDAPWRKIIIDDQVAGSPHDVIACDIDGDGVLELVANNIDAHPGLFIYKREDPARIDGPWHKAVVQTGYFEEGLAAADIDGDGRIELSAGPNLYTQTAGGEWTRHALAPDFREMCRNAAIDIDGDGVAELVVIESEYMDGRIAWFDHTLAGWVRHDLPGRHVFGHSLDARRDSVTGRVTIFIAEMAQGGWNPPYNWDARLLELISDDNGAHWREERVYTGAGTHEAEACDIDGDGEIEYVGKECFRPKVQIYKRRKTPALSFAHAIIDRDRAVAGAGLFVHGQDLVTGRYRYRASDWEREALPGVDQVLAAGVYRGKPALIATSLDAPQTLMLLKSTADGVTGEALGVFEGAPHTAMLHASTVYLAGEAGLFSFERRGSSAWAKTHVLGGPLPKPIRALATVRIDCVSSIVAGPYLIDRGPLRVLIDFDVAQLAVADIDGDGCEEVIAGEYLLDATAGAADPSARLAWFKPRPLDGQIAWHVIDRLRCPRSIGVGDLNGDGVSELVVGEHDPFKPYRNRSRLMLYQRADPAGRSWMPSVIDDRFEHCNAARVFQLPDGTPAIASQGATEARYVHVWSVRR